MIRFNNDRRTAVVYSCGICNLNCRYCMIDKNPVLKDIDDLLEESFKGDYYFNRIKEYFPRPDQLKRFETWGGEPFLRMDRVYPLVHKLINYYPYFKEMFSSTNFSYDTWIDQFMGLMNVFAQYPYREFEYQLQLSVDGPEYINDANRGKGVTERCIKNFDKLVQIIKDGKFPQNVRLGICIKGTWDLDCIRKLNDKQKIIEFYQFYEDAYMQKIRELNNPKIFFGECIPNTATPAPTTKEDGIIFAELVKKCREIEKENDTQHYFKYYHHITPYVGLNGMGLNYSYQGICAGCGSGQSMLGFLPLNHVSSCHEGFTLLVDQYKQYAAKRSDENLTVSVNKFFEEQPTPMCLTDDEYIQHENKMSYLNVDSPAQIANSVITVMTLAMAGEIDKRYLDEEEALKAATYVLQNTSFCIKANYAITGSFALEPFDLYKLLLNGALDYLIEATAEQGGCNCNGTSCDTCR